MTARRGASGLSGILLVDKPSGPTSHDVVAAVRRASGERRVGHAGTLDPAATGLLVVLVGPATRLEPYLSGARKTYEARIAFGAETDTDDADGVVTRTAPAPALTDRAAVQALLDTFLGTSQQTPPTYSAIKVAGRVAHRVARGGEELTLPPREVTVFEARLVGVDADAGAIDVVFTVSKGTYIRALARDIGRAAGSAAHLAILRRTASGRLSVDEAHTLDDIRAAGERGALPALFTDPLIALDLPALAAPEKLVSNGRPIPTGTTAGIAEQVDDGALVAVTCDGALGGIYRKQGDAFAPETVLATPIGRVTRWQ